MKGVARRRRASALSAPGERRVDVERDWRAPAWSAHGAVAGGRSASSSVARPVERRASSTRATRASASPSSASRCRAAWSAYCIGERRRAAKARPAANAAYSDARARAAARSVDQPSVTMWWTVSASQCSSSRSAQEARAHQRPALEVERHARLGERSRARRGVAASPRRIAPRSSSVSASSSGGAIALHRRAVDCTAKRVRSDAWRCDQRVRASARARHGRARR